MSTPAHARNEPARPRLRDVTNEYRISDLLSEINGVRLPGPGWEHVAVATEALAGAVEELRSVGGSEDTVAVRIGPAGVEFTVRCGRAWETAVIGVASTDADLRGAVPIEALATALAATTDEEVILGSNGSAIAIGPDVLATATLAITPPRPTGGPSAVRRVQLPPGLPAGIALRLDSVNLVVPEELRARFGRRRISMTTLYEDAGSWFLSGISDGHPMVVVTGEVAVF